MYRSFFKRLLDIVSSATALVVLSPLMLVIAILVYLEDRGPVIFKQKRVGKDGALFNVLKFRSMPENIGDVESAKADGLPITRIGRLIRRTNMDELPQLVNVLRGNMSLVGPRPPIPSQKKLCLMRVDNGSMSCLPGLTGLAQVNGYDGMPDTEKAKWDGVYASRISLLTDLRIILRTFGYLRRKPPVY
jgi:O-antigen biosynthesis protein WbqP